MPPIFFAAQPGVAFGVTGAMYYGRPQFDFAAESSALPADQIINIPIPSGLFVTNQKPALAIRNGDSFSRLYITGWFTDNAVLTENFQVRRQGIIPPPQPIFNVAGSGFNIGLVASAGPGVTGQCIGYVSWWDNTHARRSPLSGPSPTFALANQARTWSNLPTNPGDPSVTHIELWVSMDGNTPRLVTRRQLGTTTAVENVASLSLGEAFDQDFQRFPRCKMNSVWHDRQWMAGDDRYPDRLYYSLLNEPERYPNPGGYIPTRMGDKIVAILALRDQLLIGTAQRWYTVTGFTEDDLEMQVLEPGVGAINHHCNVNVHNLAIVASPIGPYVTTGTSFHFIGQDMQKTWREEYKANQPAWENAWAFNDTEENVYRMYVGNMDFDPLLSGKPNWWVIDYTTFIQEVGGSFGRGNLSIDNGGRTYASGAMLCAPGGKFGKAYLGGALDGSIYRDNYLQDADDAGLAWTQIIRTKHYFPNGPGGSDADGIKLDSLWTYGAAKEYLLDVYMGDESARDAETFLDPPDAHTRGGYHENVQDLEEFEPVTGAQVAEKVVHYSEPQVSGRGFTLEYTRTVAASAAGGITKGGNRWSGFGAIISPGENIRGRLARKV